MSPFSWGKRLAAPSPQPPGAASVGRTRNHDVVALMEKEWEAELRDWLDTPAGQETRRKAEQRLSGSGGHRVRTRLIISLARPGLLDPEGETRGWVARYRREALLAWALSLLSGPEAPLQRTMAVIWLYMAEELVGAERSPVPSVAEQRGEAEDAPA
jgi:hypothetical protein